MGKHLVVFGSFTDKNQNRENFKIRQLLSELIKNSEISIELTDTTNTVTSTIPAGYSIDYIIYEVVLNDGNVSLSFQNITDNEDIIKNIHINNTDDSIIETSYINNVTTQQYQVKATMTINTGTTHKIVVKYFLSKRF